MPTLRYRIEAEFSINEILSLSWALQWAYKRVKDGSYGKPQKQVVEKIQREEKRIWRQYQADETARQLARAEERAQKRRLADERRQEEEALRPAREALHKERMELQRQRDQVADGESGQAALAGDFQAFYEARERELNGLELNSLSDQVEK